MREFYERLQTLCRMPSVAARAPYAGMAEAVEQ